MGTLQQSGEGFLERGFFSHLHPFYPQAFQSSGSSMALACLLSLECTPCFPQSPSAQMLLGVPELHILCSSSDARTWAAASPVNADSSASQILQGVLASLLFFKGTLKFCCLDMVSKADFREQGSILPNERTITQVLQALVSPLLGGVKPLPMEGERPQNN